MRTAAEGRADAAMQIRSSESSFRSGLSFSSGGARRGVLEEKCFFHSLPSSQLILRPVPVKWNPEPVFFGFIEEVFRISFGRLLSVRHEHKTVCVGEDLLKIMGYDDYRLSPGMQADHLSKEHPHPPKVEAGKGLVEDYEIGAHREHPGDSGLFFLTA